MHHPAVESVARFKRSFAWSQVDSVFLDMDGTLLDRHFDDYFWECFVPENYSLQQNISLEEARLALKRRYQDVQHTLQWADLHFWSFELGLDIVALKEQIASLVQILPWVTEFLSFCRQQQKQLVLVTNAHPETLRIKLAQAPLAAAVDRVIWAEQVGVAKEQALFWQRLADLLPYDRQRTLLIDDTEHVLSAASDFGIAHLLHIARPNMRKAPRYSASYPSILSLQELLGTK